MSSQAPRIVIKGYSQRTRIKGSSKGASFECRVRLVVLGGLVSSCTIGELKSTNEQVSFLTAFISLSISRSKGKLVL